MESVSAEVLYVLETFQSHSMAMPGRQDGMYYEKRNVWAYLREERKILDRNKEL